jgi:tetratricopeptide (TPR) repeat protein
MNKAIQTNFKNDSPNTDEEYQALLRALRRKQGFGLFFVQASPARGQKILQQLQTDLPTKRIETVKLERASKELFVQLDGVWQQQPVGVFWIEGLEQSLLGYEDIKRLDNLEGEDLIHYSWQDVPPILAHLNLGRERFAQQFTCALVFVVPLFVIKYLLRRAADFFDWKSGFFEFPDDVYGEVQNFVAASNYETYQNLDPAVRTQRILEIKSCLGRVNLETDEQASLYREMGRLFASEGDDETAILTYDKAVAIKPDDYKLWYSKGLALKNLNRYKEAVASFEQAVKIQPDNPDAWNLRGIILDDIGRYEEAINSFDQALKIQPDNPYTWYFRGIALDGIGRYEKAIDSFDQALKIQPDSPYTWYFRGITLDHIGRYEEAIDSFDQALKIQPNDHYAWNNRGKTLQNIGLYEEAVASYDKALEIKPDFYQAWFDRASTLSRMGRSEDAITSYDKVLEIQPAFSTACHNRALALSGIGRYEEAIIGFRRAIELSPSAITWMCLGGALRSMGRYEESLASYDKAIEMRSEGTHWEWSGRIIPLFKLGRFREAFFSSYKYLLSFRIERGFREWIERRIAIYLRRFGLQKLVPVWTRFLCLIRWKVKNW